MTPPRMRKRRRVLRVAQIIFDISVIDTARQRRFITTTGPYTLPFFTNNNRGLGFMVQSAGEFLATDVVLAGIAVIAIIAFLLELGLRALQRRLTPWHGEVQ